MDSTWWTVLYIAFGIVALWLLGEVLLQYKARLRWRLLAFFGFLGVVAGVLVSSIVVIVVGAVAFGVGQTYVTLSFLRGFSTGWALGGRPGASRRRRTGGAREGKPTLEVSDLSYEGAQAPPAPEEPPAPWEPPVHETRPLPDDTGEYGVYDADHGRAHGHDAHAAGRTDPAGHTDYTGHGDYSGHADHAAYDPGGYAPAHDYGTGDHQQQYAAYSDPYIGTTTAPVGRPYGAYDGYGDGQAYADPYAAQYGMDTPPGGVWVPPQRDGEQPPPQEPPSPYGHDQGDRQYRY
ncbi:hypothetical protein [Streptomyces sp. DH12]|uniref:hypothetical protein n=1 Tax=Streptomyces sp. DH12 TaxID=2857010 RepID=UPI001E450DA4|nr:hypothetical protein [Streptomyces sp. DH12]